MWRTSSAEQNNTAPLHTVPHQRQPAHYWTRTSSDTMSVRAKRTSHARWTLCLGSPASLHLVCISSDHLPSMSQLKQIVWLTLCITFVLVISRILQMLHSLYQVKLDVHSEFMTAVAGLWTRALYTRPGNTCMNQWIRAAPNPTTAYPLLASVLQQLLSLLLLLLWPQNKRVAAVFVLEVCGPCCSVNEGHQV